MNDAGIFISYTTADDAIVAEIREALEGQGLRVWVDSRELTGGDDLDDEVFERIEAARHFIVVLSPRVINSRWVAKEINHALWVRKKRNDGYKVIPILLDGVEPSALHLWFGEEEPVAVRIGSGHDAVAKALPELLAALGEWAPSDRETDAEKPPAPSANLTLKLNDLTMSTAGGKRRAKATATLVYRPLRNSLLCRGNSCTTARATCSRAPAASASAAASPTANRTMSSRPTRLFAFCWSAPGRRTTAPPTSTTASAPARSSMPSPRWARPSS